MPHTDPLLTLSFNALHSWFQQGHNAARNWNETPEIATVYQELKDLHFWWNTNRPLRAIARNINERAAYHRIDTEQLIRLMRIREFIAYPNIIAPFHCPLRASEMDLIQFRTEDLALEVCRRGTVAGVCVVSQDHITGSERCDMDFYAAGDTPLNKVRAAAKLLDYLSDEATKAGCTHAEVDRAMGIPKDDDEDRGF